MDKIHLVGLSDDKEAIIDALMRLGAIELSETEGGLSDRSVSDGDAAIKEQSLSAREASDMITRMKNAIELSGRFYSEKKPMFSSKRKVTTEEFSGTVAEEDIVEAKASRLQENVSEIAALNTRILKNSIISAQMEPWKDIRIRLDRTDTEQVAVRPGIFSSASETELLRNQLAEEIPESEVVELSGTEEFVRALVVFHKDHEDKAMQIIKNSSFKPLISSAFTGYPIDIYNDSLNEIELAENEIGRLTEECKAIASDVRKFEILYDHASILFDKAASQSMLRETDYTFILQGWIPSHLTEAVEKALHSDFIIAFKSRKATAEDEYPILLKNHPLIKPYEVVTEMFSPPSVRDVDPNPIMAPFFLLFFSMMLSDAGYGMLLAIGCALLIWKFKVSGGLRSMAMFIFQGGLASIIWGLLFGGFFGDLITAVSSGRFSFPTIWFNPLNDPTRLMIWSVIFGAIHLFAGMLTKAYILIITGKWKDAVFDIFSWIIALTGLGILLGGSMTGIPVLSQIGKYMAAAGFATILLFGGREAKNPVMRILKGAISLYDITSYFSDMLSYTRILALSLATAVIGMVVNMLGGIMGFGFVGIILFVVVGVFGHTLNLAISALGCYVHTSRLQYVEFFSKFYEGGGRSWDPLKFRTKYIDISKDTIKARK